MKTDMSDLTNYLNEKAQKVDQALNNLWSEYGATREHPLFQAMNYSLLAPGKRLRPILCLAASEAAGGRDEQVMFCACALEMLHTYSLIHDDLPAMDNDDYRRGRPTNHKVYGEAMAILAGDALLTYAMQLLVTPPPGIDLGLAFKVARVVAKAVGPQGMVGGQADDMLAEKQEPGLEMLQTIHARKTGTLITASLLSGAMLAGADNDFLRLLESYGQKVGLAFQIADDILDVEGNRQEMGKSLGKDCEQGKLTYPALVGMEASKELGRRLTTEAVELAGQMHSRPLAWLAEYVMKRSK